MKILFLHAAGAPPGDRDVVTAALSGIGGIELAFATAPDEVQAHSDTAVLICPTLPWLPAAIEHLPALEWIHFLSAGVDRIWEMPFSKSRYAMSKSSGVHAATITEYVLGALLYVLKGFGTFAVQQHRREWRRFRLDECAGKTLAIIGLGSIGTRLAAQARSLGFRVIGTVGTAREIPGVEAVYPASGLHKALSEADFVVVLVPLTAATRGMFGLPEFGAMKQTAWFINVARGEIVDSEALVAALRQKVIAGAVLDVFDHEPLPANSPLWEMANVLITPHVAGTTQLYLHRAMEIFRLNFDRWKSSGTLVTPVSVERGY